MTVKILTNNQPRYTLDAQDLTLEERKGFDYLDWEKIDAGIYSGPAFVRYRGWIFDLDEFMAFGAFADDPLIQAGWQGYQSDSYFSGILVKYTDVSEGEVIMGRYYS